MGWNRPFSPFRSNLNVNSGGIRISNCNQTRNPTRIETERDKRNIFDAFPPNFQSTAQLNQSKMSSLVTYKIIAVDNHTAVTRSRISIYFRVTVNPFFRAWSDDGWLKIILIIIISRKRQGKTEGRIEFEWDIVCGYRSRISVRFGALCAALQIVVGSAALHRD